MGTTHARRYVNAPRAAVYRALLDPADVARWKVPDGMRCEVHAFDAREGGAIRISLTYDAPNGTGKTTAQTDTYGGRFVELVPDVRVVEIDAFESADPALQGEMRITFELFDAEGGGTDIVATHEGVPEVVPPADNELGWQLSLGKLARLVESRTGAAGT